MAVKIQLIEMRETSNYVPLGVLGYCLSRTKFLKPVWGELEIEMKTVDHAPEAKLQDILVSILAGCRAISQVNTRIRPDMALAQGWGRERFADQSMLARMLDDCGPAQVEQVRQGCGVLLGQEGYVFKHNFQEEWLYLDVDLTPLPISKRAEGSTKGKFEKKTAMVGNWLGSTPRSITKPCYLKSIRVNKIVDPPIFQS